MLKFVDFLRKMSMLAFRGICKMKKMAVFVSFFVLVAVLAYPQQFSLKLNGGIYMNFGNDYNKGIDGLNNYLKDDLSPVTGTFEKFTNALTFQGEFIFHFSPNMAIGIGGGYFQWSKSNSVTCTLLGYPDDIMYKPTLSVIPIFANFHYLTSIAPSLGIDLYAGPGIYITKFDWSDSDTFILWDLEHTFSANSTAVGFQAGIGLDFQLAPNISLVVDGFYRYAKITELKGTLTESGSVFGFPLTNTFPNSYLWYYEDDYTGTNYARVSIGPDMPSGAGISGARKAEIDLSGITAMAGIKINF